MLFDRTATIRILLLAGVGCLPGSSSAAEDRMVPAGKVENVGRYKIQTFTVAPGDSIQTDRGGVIQFLELREKQAVVKRTFQGNWSTGGEYAIGNHECLEITAIDVAKRSASVRLRTTTRPYPWEAVSF